MSATGVMATHERAGCVEPTRLAVRLAEPNAPADASSPLRAEAPFRSGTVALGPCTLDVRVAAGPAAACHIDTAIRHRSDRPLRLESVVLGFRWTGHDVSSFRFLRHGWQSWSFTGARALDAAGEPPFPSGAWLRGLHHAVGAPPADRAGWHESELVSVVAGASVGPACLVGALERGRAFSVIHLRREGDAVLVEVELRVDAVLAPGEGRELERVRVALGEDACTLLEAFAEEHGRLAGARVSHPFAPGWCSWYHFFHEVSEDDVLRNLEALAAARDEIPIEVVQVDDGYQRAVGDWLQTNARFPSGLPRLAAEIRSAGFTPGLWTAPFCAVPESDLVRDHRDWLLARGGEPLRGLLHPAWAADASVFVLDPSRSEVCAHLEALFRTLVEMGFSHLKLDFLYAAALAADAADPGLARAARLRRGLDAIRAGAGEEAFLLGCGCPLGAAVGVVDGMRIGPDVAPTWRPETPLDIPGLEATHPSTRSAVRSILARAWMHRRLWQNDPDCLLARPDTKLTPAEAATLAGAIASTGGMAFFSDDTPALPSERRRLVRDTIETAQRVDRLGLPGRARTLQLLEREFASGVVAADATGGVLALVAAGDEGASPTLHADALGLAPTEGPPDALLGTRPVALAADGHLAVSLAPHESAVAGLRRRSALAVFCDFDGTFSVQDVGATLAKRHAGEKRPAVWARYERGELTAWQYNLEVLEGLALPKTHVEAFLRGVELDPGARDLVGWCERHGVPFRVLSDGFDHNLNRLQQIHGVRFAYDANRLRYERGRWRIHAGHPNPACGCGTGTCKAGRIEAFRAASPGARLVHIGNGRVSDLCGALAADVVFAKDTLALELADRGVPFEPFHTLHDVIPALARLLG